MLTHVVNVDANHHDSDHKQNGEKTPRHGCCCRAILRNARKSFVRSPTENCNNINPGCCSGYGYCSPKQRIQSSPKQRITVPQNRGLQSSETEDYSSPKQRLTLLQNRGFQNPLGSSSRIVRNMGRIETRRENSRSPHGQRYSRGGDPSGGYLSEDSGEQDRRVKLLMWRVETETYLQTCHTTHDGGAESQRTPLTTLSGKTAECATASTDQRCGKPPQIGEERRTEDVRLGEDQERSHTTARGRPESGLHTTARPLVQEDSTAETAEKAFLHKILEKSARAHRTQNYFAPGNESVPCFS